MGSEFEHALYRWDPNRDQTEVIKQTNLGLQYYHGQGVAQDYKKAVSLVEAAAKAGFPPAQRVLGSFYEAGKAVPRNEDEALRWYEIAGQQGDRDAAAAARLIKDRRSVHAEISRVQASGRSDSTRSKCFIATAAYSEDAWQVQELRRFRDESLRRTRAGTAAIKAYEFLSPPVARMIQARPGLQALVRRVVDPIARIIRSLRR